MDNVTLANVLAREIFAVGCELNDKVQRTQFMGGRWPNNETELGGLNETALASVILRVLHTANPSSEPK